MPNTYPFRIADIPITIDTDMSLPMEDAFRPFLTEAPEPPRYTAVFRQVASLPPFPETVIWEDHCCRVHPDGHGGFLRTFFDEPRDRAPYAVATYDYAAGRICIRYLERGRVCVSELSNSFFHLGIEALLIGENRVCFHASCIRTAFGGILFSGPSGVGKSTQADLWCSMRNACLINGDRPILGRAPSTPGAWLAWGSPYAGSSRCYVNESVPVSAIVMLSQAPVCTVERLPAGRALRAVFSGITVNSYSESFMTAAFDMATAIQADVPVYQMACTPDENAVQALEKRLAEDGIL